MLKVLICGILIPIITMLCIQILFDKKFKIVTILYSVFLMNIVGNICTYIYSQKLIMHMNSSVKFYGLYFILTAIVCLLIHKVERHVNKGVPFPKKSFFVFCSISIMLFVYFGWFLSTSGRMNFDQLIYNLNTPLNTETTNFESEVIGIILTIGLPIITLAILLWKEHRLRSSKPLHKGMKKRFFAIYFLMFISWIMLPFYAFHLEDAYYYLQGSEEFYVDHYVNPDNVEITFPQQKRNLLLIFVESYESSFFSKEQGGLEDVELMPEMTNMMNTGDNFSQNDGFGGAMNMPGTNWTIAGMSATLGGMNYNLPSYVNADEGDVAVLPGLVTLNDILEDEGYREYFMIGLNSNMYNLGAFYRYHGSSEITDYGSVRNDGLLPMDYLEGWGFEDSKLYGFAQSILSEHPNDEPFAMYLSTNDLHGPDGYIDKSCSAVYNDYRDAISCSSKLTAEFLDWVKEQPFYDNTTIVVVGDHVSNAGEYTKKYDPEDRAVFNLFLNSDTLETDTNFKQRSFFAADYFPTILSSMGVKIEGNRLGLGVNLYSDEDTLIEEYGRDSIKQKLLPNTNYYDENFLQVSK